MTTDTSQSGTTAPRRRGVLRHRPDGVLAVLATVAVIAAVTSAAGWLWFLAAASAAYALAASP
ncbi:MAG TPA: hypothetical protein VFZ70_01140 [Euzebyales bacterium]